MNQTRRVAVIAAALTVIGAGWAAAQHPQTRQGFWIAFGLGYGSANISCDDPDVCGGGSESGGTAHIRLGGTLNERTLLGGDLTAWTKEESGATATFGNASFVVQYYPMPAGGLFLKGGVGFSSISFEFVGVTADGTSFGVSAGAGYDIRVGRNISITPIVDFLYGGSRDLKVDGQTAITGMSKTLLTVGLGVTFH